MSDRPAGHPSQGILRAFGLGELDAAATAAVRRHLAVCTDCAGKMAALPGATTVMKGAPGYSPAGPAVANLPRELADNPQYEVLRELGRGGMGVVYLARNRLMDRLEVLKVVSKDLLDLPGALERFLREIRSAARLNHPNVVTAYAALQLGQLLVLAMEYVDGQDLAEVVSARGPLPVTSACLCAYQAALGLQHAFEKGMVHRDIKPQNLILAQDGKRQVVKVLDFGLAKATSERRERDDITAPNRMLGTPNYVAPEQVGDAARADIRADIYSLGCTLYHLLTGAPPFAADNLYGILHGHMSKEARSLSEVRPEVPRELSAVVARMMVKDPARRYQKPVEVAQALAPFARSMPSQKVAHLAEKPVAIPPTLVERKSPAVGRSRKAADKRDWSRMWKERWWLPAAVAAALLIPVAVGLLARGVFRRTTADGPPAVVTSESSSEREQNSRTAAVAVIPSAKAESPKESVKPKEPETTEAKPKEVAKPPEKPKEPDKPRDTSKPPEKPRVPDKPTRTATGEPLDNPIATFYSGPEGYPAWTDSVNWSRVINMKTYAKGQNDYQKFTNAQKELAEVGGVLYYPAGTYDFTTKDPGRGLMLIRGVVIRGEAPAGHPVAADGNLDLPTKFIFKFRERSGGKVPADWNIIGLGIDDFRDIKSEDHLGIAWVHLVGATVAFGPQFDWGNAWGTADSMLSAKVKKGGWDMRHGEGVHPIDPLMCGGKAYKGGTRGRFVFGCVLEDAAVLDDFSDPGYGKDGFHSSRYCARVIVYGSRVLVANNLLPPSQKNFSYRQRTSAARGDKDTNQVTFDYGKTIGIDVNKELLIHARQDGTCPGYFEEGVVVRDNWVYNHGHTGYSISGKWVSIANNRNERAVLRSNDPFGVLTLDGWEATPPDQDYRSRAFDLAGRCLWVDGNRFNNTGSAPGKDGEGIVCRPANGTQLYSWAITHNARLAGNGGPGSMGGMDADCHGLLIGWNQTAGWVGNLTEKRKDAKLVDCAFLANRADRVMPRPMIFVQEDLSAPTKVTAEVYQDDAVRITWRGTATGAAGFKVKRRIGEGKWQVIAYRPKQSQGDAENPPEWVDFTAPPGQELSYRVVAIDADDTDKAASDPTAVVTLARPR
jgi:serine/threonine protein kinase